MTKVDICELKVKTSDGTINSAFDRTGTAATVEVFADMVGCFHEPPPFPPDENKLPKVESFSPISKLGGALSIEKCT